MEISLKTIKLQLQEVKKHFTYSTEQAYTSPPPGVPKQPIGFVFTGLNKIRHALLILKNTNLFNEIVNYLYSSAIFTTSSDIMTIASDEANLIITNLNNLKILIDNFISVLNIAVPIELPNSVNIKLPENIIDFEDLSKVSEEIHIILSQVLFNQEINGETKINSVENGSIWLNVLLGTPAAISLVASLTWAAAVIRKKIFEGNIIREQIRTLSIKNTSLEDIEQGLFEEIKNLIAAESAFIDDEHFKDNQPENIERIKNSVKMLAELFNKGAEISPAITAPENVSNLFPDLKNILGIGSKIKELGNGASKN